LKTISKLSLFMTVAVTVGTVWTVSIATASPQVAPMTAAVHVSALDDASPLSEAGSSRGTGLASQGIKQVKEALRTAHLEEGGAVATLVQMSDSQPVYLARAIDSQADVHRICVIAADSRGGVAFSCAPEGVLATNGIYLGTSEDGTNIKVMMVAPDGYSSVTTSAAGNASVTPVRVKNNIAIVNVTPAQNQVTLTGTAGTKTVDLGSLGRP